MSRTHRSLPRVLLAFTFAGVYGVLAAAIGVTQEACSGAESSDLFQGDTDGGEGGASTGASTGSGTTQGTTTSGTTGTTSGTTGSTGGNATVACQSNACQVGDEVCCRRAIGPAFTYACEAPKECDGSGSGAGPLAIVCDDASDCEALGARDRVCCGEYEVDSTNQPRVQRTACLTRADCTRNRQRVILCGDGDSSVCLSNQKCDVSSVALPGYRICSG